MLTRPNFVNCQVTFSHESDDTICYSIEESKTLLKFAERGYYSDTLIKYYDNEVQTLEEIISSKNNQILLAESTIYGLNNKVDKIEKEKKLWMGLSAASLLGLLFMILF